MMPHVSWLAIGCLLFGVAVNAINRTSSALHAKNEKENNLPDQTGLDEEYMNWEKVYISYAKIHDHEEEAHNQLNEADQKASDVGIGYHASSVKIINLYTQQSYLSDLHIHDRVNEYLEYENGDKIVWGAYSNLLDQAIDNLCGRTWGCRHNAYMTKEPGKDLDHDDITFKSYTTTTKHPNVALNSATSVSSVYLEMLQVRGIVVKLFSAFPKDGEILLDRCYRFSVIQRVTGEDDIKRSIRRVGANPDHENLKYLTLFMNMTSVYRDTGDELCNVVSEAAATSRH